MASLMEGEWKQDKVPNPRDTIPNPRDIIPNPRDNVPNPRDKSLNHNAGDRSKTAEWQYFRNVINGDNLLFKINNK